MSCDLCGDLHRPVNIGNVRIPELRGAMELGCSYCRLLFSALEGMLRLEDIDLIMISTTSSRFDQITVEAVMQPDYKPKFGGLGPQSRALIEEIILSVPEGGKTPGDWIRTVKDVPLDPKSSKSMDFVRRNLEQCLSNHSCHSSAAQLEVLPKRVVRIGDRREDLKVHEYHQDDGPYVALSHCWGGDIALQLRTNSPGLYEKIDPGLLPMTFLDATFLAFELGFRNIWIDSLCICQDSASDWALESAKMGDIYRNAIVTIAGSSSAGSSIPFLRTRDEAANPTLELRFIDEAGDVYNIKATRYMELHDDTENGPLHQRAWCLQEYFLSTRVISYEPAEIRWRCLEENACQCSPAHLPSQTYEVLLAPQDFEPWEILNCWTEIVARYSARKLTYATDRLPALAGIASTIQRATNWTYLGGFWEDEIIRCMCWSTMTNPLPRLVSPSDLPSFTWASIPGGIWYEESSEYKPEISSLIKYMRGSCELTTQNPFGNISGGFIELETHVVEATLSCTRTDLWNSYFAQCLGKSWRMDPDVQLTIRKVGVGEHREVPARFSKNGPVQEFSGVNIHIVFLATSIWDESDYVHAIAVRELDEREESFERIGLMSHWGEGLENDSEDTEKTPWMFLFQKSKKRRIVIR